MNLTDFPRRADEIIALGNAVISTFHTSLQGFPVQDAEAFGTFRAAALSFLDNTFGREHPYFEEFSRQTKAATHAGIRAAKGVLVAARDEVAGGWAVTARGIVSAQIFADFLEMADHLLNEQYKDAAAVMTGSTLEEHLRQLAKSRSIPVEVLSNGVMVPKKAAVLNVDLVKAGVYGLLQQKSITAWLDLRNKAAHGKYSEYSEAEVRLMWQGVTQFMSQYAA